MLKTIGDLKDLRFMKIEATALSSEITALQSMTAGAETRNKISELLYILEMKRLRIIETLTAMEKLTELLSQRERVLFRLHYIENKPLQAVSEQMFYSIRHINSLNAQILKKLEPYIA